MDRNAASEVTLPPPPEHVPPDRIIDFDVYDFPVNGTEYQRSMVDQLSVVPGEMIWTPRNGGHWIAKSAKTVMTVLSDAEHFSSRHTMVPKTEVHATPFIPLELDPPAHTPYRALLQQSLSPRKVRELNEKVRVRAVELIDGFKNDGRCEFMGDFAMHLPIEIFMRLVDLPMSDRLMLTGMAERSLRGETEAARQEAKGDIAGYGMAKVHERRLKPGDDLISRLALAEVDGERMSDATLTGMLSLLLIAGLDSVATVMGFMAHFLATSPDHRRQLLDDPGLIPHATEELIRRFPIVILAREVKADIDLGGVRLKAGDMVSAPTPLDNFDESKFPNPFEVDFARKRPSLNASFGGGVHQCMGAMLARSECSIFLEEWLKRIPDFRVEPGFSPTVEARVTATIPVLPLTWTT